MTALFLSDPHATAFHAAVVALWPLTGDAKVPTADLEYDENGLLRKPYAVVYPLDASEFDGSLAAADVQGDAWPLTQVTYVGASRSHADQVRDRIRTGLAGVYLTVAGRKVGPVRLEQQLPTRRDDTVTPALFYAVDIFRTYTTPGS